MPLADRVTTLRSASYRGREFKPTVRCRVLRAFQFRLELITAAGLVVGLEPTRVVEPGELIMCLEPDAAGWALLGRVELV